MTLPEASCMVEVANPYRTDTLEPAGKPVSLWRQILNWFLALAVVFLLLVVVPATLLIGILIGEGHSTARRAAEQRWEIQKFTEARRDQYAQISFDERSVGETYMKGTVSSPEDLEELHAECVRLFGEETAKRMTREIEVKPPLSDGS